MGRLTSSCLSYEYTDFVYKYREVSWSSSVVLRQWIYQTCAEYGWYQTSGSKNQPFGSSFPLELYLTMCRDFFDES